MKPLHVYTYMYIPVVISHNLHPLCTFTLVLKALGHDISKRFVTKLKRIVHGPSFR